MGVTSFFKNCTFLMAILILLSSFLLDCAMANVYAVGDQEEWSSQTNYASWAERYNFSLGDVLGMVFNLSTLLIIIVVFDFYLFLICFHQSIYNTKIFM